MADVSGRLCAEQLPGIISLILPAPVRYWKRYYHQHFQPRKPLSHTAAVKSSQEDPEV